jgi:hypothetical protein
VDVFLLGGGAWKLHGIEDERNGYKFNPSGFVSSKIN